MRLSGIIRAFMQARSLSAGPLIAVSSAAGMPSGSEGNAQLASGACAMALPASAPANVAVIPSTAMPATATINLDTNLFTLPPLPLLTDCCGGQTIPKVHNSHEDVTIFVYLCYLCVRWCSCVLGQ